jgi:hypothetical protein
VVAEEIQVAIPGQKDMLVVLDLLVVEEILATLAAKVLQAAKEMLAGLRAVEDGLAVLEYLRYWYQQQQQALVK